MILLDDLSSAHSRLFKLWLLLLFAIAYSYSVASFQIAKNNIRSTVRSSHPNHCSFRRPRRDYNGIVLLPSASATLVSVSSLIAGDNNIKYNINSNNNRKSTKLFDSEKLLALEEVEEGSKDDENNNNNKKNKKNSNSHNDNFVFIWEDSGFEYNDEYNFHEDEIFDGYNDGEDVIVKWRRFLPPSTNKDINNSNNHNHNNEDITLDNEGIDSDSDTNNSMDPNTVNAITKKTMNWCNEFVMKLELCPFAKASLQTKGAMRFFLVPPITIIPPPAPSTTASSSSSASSASSQSVVSTTQLQLEEEYRNRRIVDDVAKRFQTEILNNNNYNNNNNGHSSDDDNKNSKPGVGANDMLERAAIYFVIFLSSNDENNNSSDTNERNPQAITTTTTTTTTTSSFIDFLDWFNDLEDNWSEDCDDVIIAPFHPDWQFEGDEYALNYEKRSPYPLISIVSTNVVEKAGEAVTELIGENNREILLSIEKEDKKENSEGEGGGGGGAVAKLWQSSIDR